MSNTERLLELYRQMLLIRRFEEQVGKMARQKALAGFPHTYVGEEAVAAGVCAHLNARDMVFSTHRGHGHALAMGCEPRYLLAELLGKSTGYGGGRAGSMHLSDPEKGFMGSNGIVASCLPLAVGGGLTAWVKKSGAVSVVFFGDGASNHGSFHESLNLASKWALPVLFVCENNQYATHTRFDAVAANTNVASRAAAYNMPGHALDGNDVWAVYEAAGEAVTRARKGEGPTLLECHTYRVVGHHEHGPVFGEYRTRAEVDSWKQRCPIKRLKEGLLASEAGAREQIEAEVSQIIAEAACFAVESPYPEAIVSEQQVFA